jgi:glycerophosphoryl diester phosphodiesterase
LARKDVRGRKVPQTIAHRGCKVEFPENTMKAFEGAVKVGAHAIETDIHISKDHVIVLSHVSAVLVYPTPLQVCLYFPRMPI